MSTMKHDEFWIEPVEIVGHEAVLRASFNDCTVTIRVERKDRAPISQQQAVQTLNDVIARVPKGRGR